MENVVFRDGVAYGLIDFDMTARYWVPMLDPETAAQFPSYAGLDPVHRLRILAGDEASVKAFHRHGGWVTWDRLQAWLIAQRATFLDALS
nr:hypothetical protein [Catenulispora acidiphila]